jgi:hypothetical protein
MDAAKSARQARRRLTESLLDAALSHCRKKNAIILRLEYFLATATAARHMFIADARKTRWGPLK